MKLKLSRSLCNYFEQKFRPSVYSTHPDYSKLNSMKNATSSLAKKDVEAMPSCAKVFGKLTHPSCLFLSLLPFLMAPLLYALCYGTIALCVKVFVALDFCKKLFFPEEQYFLIFNF